VPLLEFSLEEEEEEQQQQQQKEREIELIDVYEGVTIGS
jgi:hypothetical protein